MPPAPTLRLLPSVAPLTWAEASDEFLRLSPNLAESTRAAYRSDLHVFGEFLAAAYRIADPGAVTPYHVRAFTVARPDLAATTIRRRLDALSTFFAYLLDLPAPPVLRNPVTKGCRPKRRPKPPREAMPEQHFAALRAATRGTLERAVFEVLAGMGLWGGEALALCRHDFEPGKLAAWVTSKGKRARGPRQRGRAGRRGRVPGRAPGSGCGPHPRLVQAPRGGGRQAKGGRGR